MPVSFLDAQFESVEGLPACSHGYAGRMPDPPTAHDREDDVEELADQAADHNPDPTTRREALELDLMEQKRSEEGEAPGDEMP